MLYILKLLKSRTSSSGKGSRVKAALVEGAVAKLIVIELYKSDNEGNNKDIYTAFKAVEVEDKVIKEAV